MLIIFFFCPIGGCPSLARACWIYPRTGPVYRHDTYLSLASAQILTKWAKIKTEPNFREADQNFETPRDKIKITKT